VTLQNLRNILPMEQETQIPVIPFQRENKPRMLLDG